MYYNRIYIYHTWINFFKSMTANKLRSKEPVFWNKYNEVRKLSTVTWLSVSVHYRMFAVTPQMEPVERYEETHLEASIAIEIVVLCFIFNKYRIDHQKASEMTPQVPNSGSLSYKLTVIFFFLNAKFICKLAEVTVDGGSILLVSRPLKASFYHSI